MKEITGNKSFAECWLPVYIELQWGNVDPFLITTKKEFCLFVSGDSDIWQDTCQFLSSLIGTPHHTKPWIHF